MDPDISVPLVTASFRERFEDVFGDTYSVVMDTKKGGRQDLYEVTIGIRRGLLHGIRVLVKGSSNRCSISIFHRSILETIVYDGTYLVTMIISCIAGLVVMLPHIPAGRTGLPSIFAGILVSIAIGFLGGSIINLLFMAVYDVVFYRRRRAEHERLMERARQEVKTIIAVLTASTSTRRAKDPAKNH